MSEIEFICIIFIIFIFGILAEDYQDTKRMNEALIEAEKENKLK
jgi:nitrogen fixation-related uncharacterized protein